ncbi:MAG TPA: glyceraldehyde 3-phosphate dehydrogenase NAD-binding domain-containing protein, partial [Patescibacteria group bacterium]|nr:glyceraldehyde 3-phosphate dehydrogenase NAD-binding domain-containing protein [Patescibacteria group bacterium]
MRIAINGFGRIGRTVFKAILDKNIKADLVAVNDLTDIKTLAHLLKYDSVYGRYAKKITTTKDSLVVDGKKIKVLAEKDPAQLPWKKMKVDLVLECTGLFRTRDKASGHLEAGAKKVVISAPAKSEDIKTIVLGVNENKIAKKDDI